MDVQDGHAPSRSKSSHGKEIFPLDTNWKKNLESHQPVDLLEDRSAETFAEWLRQHPGVEIISRDRSKDYQRGATDGAPAAQQVIDRWHLLKNLREAVERSLTHIQMQQHAQ